MDAHIAIEEFWTLADAGKSVALDVNLEILGALCVYDDGGGRLWHATSHDDRQVGAHRHKHGWIDLALPVIAASDSARAAGVSRCRHALDHLGVSA
jgi:hypothetical protein